jgi:DNA-binding SARP family transcriptional activator/tetratricopeptide (TPR) repeat protein
MVRRSAGAAVGLAPRARPARAALGDHAAMAEPVADSPLRLRLHGDAAVLWPDGRVVALERRAAAVLALAALEPGIGRQRVAAWLWPDSDDPRRNLRQQLLRFRQLFGHPLVQGEATLSLAPGLAEAGNDTASAELLGGHDYADCEDFDQWLQARRSERRLRRSASLATAIAQAESAQRLDEAIGWAEQQLRDEPGAEAHHRTLIRLHYLNQDAARARQAFEALRGMLQSHFGTGPGAETLALMRLVEQSDTAAITPASAPARVGATALQRPPRLVGRARELQALQQALSERRALLLLGEAGMGKSRLLAEGLDAGAGHVLVKAQAGDAGVPYATLARLLRRLLERRSLPHDGGAIARLLPEVAPAASAAALSLPADGERLLLQAAVEQVLQQAALQAVAVDDLHFADEASLEMLAALAGSDTLSQLAWVFTQRPGEASAAAGALREVLEEAGRLQVCELAPLDATQMVELVRSLQLGDLDADSVGRRLLRHTGGNPLFALETLKQMLLAGASGKVGPAGKALPQPASVGALIDRRLKQLSDAALALARVAAIAGPDFGPALAESVLGRRAIELADAWGELEAAQVLRERAFAHDLVLEAALRSVPKAIAEHLHAAVATHLEAQLDAHPGEPARLAGHWLAAGDERRALPWLIKAADQARDRLRRREEAGFVERAAQIAAQLGGSAPTSAHALWLRAYQALEVVDGEAAALHALEQALQNAHGERERLEVLALRASARTKQIDLAAAIADGREALQLASRLGDPRATARVLMPLAVALATHGEDAEATALLDAFWPAVEALEDAEPSNFIEHGVVLDYLGRPLEARVQHRRGIALALQRGQHSEFVIGSRNLAVSHIDAGEMAEAMAVLDSAERMRQSHDGLQGTNLLSWNLQAIACRDLGHYGRALECFDTMLAIAREQLPVRVPLDRLHRAWLWAGIGQWTRALQDLAPGDDYGELPAWVQARALQLRDRIARLRALPAGDALQRAQAALGDGALRTVRDSIAIDAALAEGLRSPPAAATAHEGLVVLRDAAMAQGFAGIRWACEWAGAQLALAAGLRDAASAHVQACLRRPGEHTPLDIALGAWWHGLWQVAQALGQDDAATAAHAEGVAWIHRTLQQHLPEQFHAGFRESLSAHRELLAG